MPYEYAALGRYSEIAAGPGFARALSRVVTDLRLAKLKPEILRTVPPDLTCLAGLQTADAGGVRPRPCRVAVCAPSNRSDGHATPRR